MKEQLKELVSLLQQSEAQRKELIKEQKVREQTPAIGLASSASVIICLACIIMYNLIVLILRLHNKFGNPTL